MVKSREMQMPLASQYTHSNTTVYIKLQNTKKSVFYEKKMKNILQSIRNLGQHAQ